ncbi:MAG: MOSC N-terminal beta barrel domain-containing protein [Opitutae bacterium]
MHVTALHLYPVKSCRGLTVNSAELDDFGFIGDRRFLVVNAADGLFLTQRTHPRMALIETALTQDALILSSPSHGSVAVPLHSQSSPGKVTTRSVTIWKNTVIADDCGNEPAEWLSRFLGLPLRLVRLGEAFHRPVSPSKAQPGDVVMFADAYPLLLISEASLDNLNDRLVAQNEEALPMNRFRPNLVVAGCAPYAEDNWPRLDIGGVVFRNAGPCARCPVTTTDQLTAVRGKEPLRTFATYRRDAADSTKVNFGINLIHESKRGSVRVGAVVTLL